jgi:hypothetical protein
MPSSFRSGVAADDEKMIISLDKRLDSGFSLSVEHPENDPVENVLQFFRCIVGLL